MEHEPLLRGGLMSDERTANMRHNYKAEGDNSLNSRYTDLSAFHADNALGHLLESRRSDIDSRQKDLEVRQAQALATLSLRDKMDELNATIGRGIALLAESQADLSRRIETAAQYLHRDAVDLRQRLRVIQGGEAA